MKAVTRYLTRDGVLFEKEKDARVHENLLELSEWYEDHPLTEGAYTTVGWEALLDWCRQHKDKVQQILKTLQER